jgi:ADP-ribosylglycohydrolase
MKDERIHVKGWPVSVRSRQANKIGAWNRDWSRRNEHRAEFRPEGRVDGSDYNLHHLDIDTPLDAELDFSGRADEIVGRDPDTGLKLSEPNAHERFTGAILASAVGDAFGAAVAANDVQQLPWKPSVMLRDEQLTEYVVRRGLRATAVTQLSAFTVEGLIRAHVARRINPTDNDPVPEVQHAYQRWLHTQRVPWNHRGHWRASGGPYASRNADPDGWLVQCQELYVERASNRGVVGALGNFASMGTRPTLANRSAMARGGDVVPRAAMLAVWSSELRETFAAAVGVAVLIHGNPNDYLAAGVLAGILHQQIRGIPFLDCLDNVRHELVRWPGHEKTATLISKSLKVIHEEWTPIPGSRAIRRFAPGRDGAEALAAALYVAMASDYVREAFLLSMNYTENHSVVGAISGVLVGAEYGMQAIPRDLRAVDLWDVIELLAKDALVEFSPEPPTDQTWMQRYPAW